MKDDLIRRQTAITAIQKAYADTEGGADRCAVWKNVGLTNALHIMQDLPSAQPEHLVKESGNLVKGLVNDCISRQAAIDAVKQHMNNVSGGNDEYYIAHRHIIELLQIVPTAEPESHREWYMHGYRDAQRWIPVTEALPDKNGDYFVTYDAGFAEDYGYDVPIGIAPYEVDCESFGVWQERFDPRTLGVLDSDWFEIKVVAWMPLPEPWRGGQDETN